MWENFSGDENKKNPRKENSSLMIKIKLPLEYKIINCDYILQGHSSSSSSPETFLLSIV